MEGWDVGPNFKGDHSSTISDKVGPVISGGGRVREKDLNVIFYQNMPNLHNRYKSVERNISLKNPEYMLYY